jgi:hypothetical protein
VKKTLEKIFQKSTSEFTVAERFSPRRILLSREQFRARIATPMARRFAGKGRTKTALKMLATPRLGVISGSLRSKKSSGKILRDF